MPSTFAISVETFNGRAALAAIAGCVAAVTLLVTITPAPSQNWAVSTSSISASRLSTLPKATLTSASALSAAPSALPLPQDVVQTKQQTSRAQVAAHTGGAVLFLSLAVAMAAFARKLMAPLSARCWNCGSLGHAAAQCQMMVSLMSTTGEKACQQCGERGHLAHQCQCRQCGSIGHAASQCQNVAMFSATGERADESKEKMRRIVNTLNMDDMRLLTRGGSIEDVARLRGIDEVAADVKAELASRKDLTPRDVVLEMQRGNGRFWMGISEREDMTAMQRRALIMAQAPKICVLSCSDSRVPVEIIFDQSLGDIFVVRMAGNILDANAHGSIEYAVKYLGVKVLLVIGHEGCGAVKGAITMSASDIAKEPKDLQVVLNSIKANLDVKELNLINDARSREREAIVLHTSNQVKALSQNTLIAELVKQGKLLVAGAFYEISSGIVDFFSLDKNGFVQDL